MHSVMNQLLKKLTIIRIPDMLLVAAFEPQKHNRTIEALIKEKIITEMVLVDCNLHAGKIKKIPLLPSYLKPIGMDANIGVMSQNNSHYLIPPNARENREINAVIDIAYPMVMSGIGASNAPYQQGNSISSLMDNIMTSFTGTPSAHTPTPFLMANNTVRLEPPIDTRSEWVLSCLLAYDSNFTNISPHMVESLSDMVVYLTQAFVYNKLINSQELAAIIGGVQLESFRTIIESYADSHEQYQESIMKFRGAATFDKDYLISMVNLMI